MQELAVSALAQTNALTKLLIEKGLIPQAEFNYRMSPKVFPAAASLGLGSVRVDGSNEHAYKESLGYPEPLRLNIIVSIGYWAYALPPHCFPLEELIHFDRYDMRKFIQHDNFLNYLDRIHGLGRPG